MAIAGELGIITWYFQLQLNLDNIITVYIILVFHSRSLIKGRIVKHIGNFSYMSKGGTLIVFSIGFIVN